jgi:hypothetical protein
MARLTGRDDDADTAAETAREIKRMRLTAAERDAIEFFDAIHNEGYGLFAKHTATLRKLLERLK